MKKSLVGRLAQFVSWHRRALAVVSAVFAAVALALIAAPPPEPTMQVVVAARSVTGGTTLTADDVRLEHVPTRWVPAGALTDVDQAIGQVLVVGLSPPGIITGTVVLGQRSAAPGRALVPVRLADPGVLSLLRVGDVVDVVGAGVDGLSAVIASGARVAALPAMADIGPVEVGSPSGSLVVLDVPAAQASAVSGAGGQLGVGLVLR